MEKTKRERGKNYSENEKKQVMDIARKYIEIIEIKQTDAISNKRKVECWERIAEEFNRIAENGPRTPYQVKILYHSIKKQARKGIINGYNDIFCTNDQSDDENEHFQANGDIVTKIETDDDSCFEVTDYLMAASDNSCSSNNLNKEDHRYAMNCFSTPIPEDKKNNETNFSNAQKVQLNFKNDSQSNISSISRETTPVPKRERGKNYTEFEKQHFMEVVTKYEDIVDSKDNDNKTLKMKQDAWERILSEYHTFAQTGIRNKEQLKQLYYSIKKRDRKEVSNINCQEQQPKRHFDQFHESNISNNISINNIQEKNISNELNVRNVLCEENGDPEPNISIINVKTEQPSYSEAEPPSPGNRIEKEHYQPTSEPHIIPTEQHIPTIGQQIQQIPEPSTKRKKSNESKEKLSYRENVEKVKYEILLVRKEKEEIERDILLIELRKKELELKEKEYQMRNML